VVFYFFLSALLSPCLFKLELAISLALSFILKILYNKKSSSLNFYLLTYILCICYLFFLAIQIFVFLQITYETSDRGIYAVLLIKDVIISDL